MSEVNIEYIPLLRGISHSTVIWKGERNKTKYFTAYQLHSPKKV